MTEKQQEPAINKLRKRDKFFLVGAGGLLLIIVPYVYYAGVVYNHIHEYAGAQAGAEFNAAPQFRDIWISVTSATIIYFIQKMTESLMTPLLFQCIKLKDEEDEEMRQFRAKKAAKSFFMFIKHLTSTCGLVYCVWGKPWLPKYMGGSGSFANGFNNMPFSPMDRDAYFVGLILLGHPLQQTLGHFFISERSQDFAEMSLHHLAHLALASCYLFTNMIPVGTLVALCHDSNDIFVASTKVFHMCNRTNQAIVSVIICQLGWLHGRLICLPIIIYEIYANIGYPSDRSKQLDPYVNFSIILLSVLVMLHIYWFYLFQIINYNVLTKGDTRDVQNDRVAEVEGKMECSDEKKKKKS